MTTKTTTLSDSEISTLSNICRVASESFKESANTFRSMIDAPEPKPDEMFAVRGPAAASLAEQFDHQANEALEIANRLNIAVSVTVTEDTEDAVQA
jgi:hypothetical protein